MVRRNHYRKQNGLFLLYAFKGSVGIEEFVVQ